MASILSASLSINGVVSTDKDVMQNINDLCNAAGCWMTYDIAEGRWSVIINRAETVAVAHFDDSNIIGGVNVSGKGINELYNQATIEFPHKDLRDQKDFIDIAIPVEDRFPNELDKRLIIRQDLINDPVQAEYLARVEMKQSRVDKIIEFSTDYSNIGVKAGDIISVTNEQYGYVDKFFRVITISENDSDVLNISITALEYSDSVYDNSGIVREVRDKVTGIVAKDINQATVSSDNLATATSNASGATDLLTPAAIAAALALGSGTLFDFLKTSTETSKAGAAAANPGTTIPSYASAVFQLSESYVLSEFNDFSGATTGNNFVGDSSAGPYVDFQLGTQFNTMLIIVEKSYSNFTMFPKELGIFGIANSSGGTLGILDGDNPFESVYLSDYDINVVTSVNLLPGVQTLIEAIEDIGPVAREITAYVPTISTLSFNGGAIDVKDTGWQASNQIFVVEDSPAGDYRIKFQPSQTYNLGVTENTTMFHGYYNSTSGLGGMVVTVMAFKN